MHGTEERAAKRAYAESKLLKSTDRFGMKSNKSNQSPLKILNRSPSKYS